MVEPLRVQWPGLPFVVQTRGCGGRFKIYIINTDDLFIVWHSIQESQSLLLSFYCDIYHAKQNSSCKQKLRCKVVGWWGRGLGRAILEENTSLVFLLLRNKIASQGIGLRSVCISSRISGTGKNPGLGLRRLGFEPQPAPSEHAWTLVKAVPLSRCRCSQVN